MEVLVDCAGAAVGGARRFLDELMGWLSRNPGAPVRLVGLGRLVSLGHLVGREIHTVRERHRRVVTLNNIGYVATRGERWLLVRNALHFPVPGEATHVPAALARRLAAQAAIVRFTARRADVVVVPTASMAERVLRRVPGLSDRLVVAPHPVSPRPPAAISPGLVVCPVLFAPYKRMVHRLAVVAEAVEQLRRTHGWSLDVRVTATPEELRDVGRDHVCRLTPVGRLPTGELSELLSLAQVIYYPTDLESFGYPLAEARVNGQPVVAPDSAQTRQVAGGALVPYDEETPDAVAAALRKAVAEPPPAPDPGPFCPDVYFRRWLA